MILFTLYDTLDTHTTATQYVEYLPPQPVGPTAKAGRASSGEPTQGILAQVNLCVTSKRQHATLVPTREKHGSKKCLNM